MEGPFGNFEFNGPFSDDNLWVFVAMEAPGVGRHDSEQMQYISREVEQKVQDLRIIEGDGQAFATTNGNKVKVYYRTFYLHKTGADVEQVQRQSQRLKKAVRTDLEIKSIKVLCETPSPTQDVLPSQISPTFTRAGDND